MKKNEIIKYISDQLFLFFPQENDKKLRYDSDLFYLSLVVEKTSEEFSEILNKVKIFNSLSIDPYHIMQYPIYLYKLSRNLYLNNEEDKYRLKDRIHALNKYLHGVSIFYKVKMPDVFFLNYSTGIVVGEGDFSNNLVIYQGVTIGRINKEDKPKIGSDVILMPNCLVSGRSEIGKNSVISSGVRIINKTVPDNTIVFENNGSLIFKNNKSDYIKKYFSV